MTVRYIKLSGGRVWFLMVGLFLLSFSTDLEHNMTVACFPNIILKKQHKFIFYISFDVVVKSFLNIRIDDSINWVVTFR